MLKHWRENAPAIVILILMIALMAYVLPGPPDALYD